MHGKLPETPELAAIRERESTIGVPLDYQRDMAPAFAFFKSLRPRHPERAAFPNDAVEIPTNQSWKVPPSTFA